MISGVCGIDISNCLLFNTLYFCSPITTFDNVNAAKRSQTRIINEVLYLPSLFVSGFLVQAIGDRIERSYLSSKFDAKPYETRPKIESLISKLGKVAFPDREATHICNIYNCEPRSVS